MQTTDKAKIVIVGDKGIGKRTMLTTGFGKPARLSSLYVPIEFVDIELKTPKKVWNVQCYDSLISSAAVSKDQATIVEGFTAQIVSKADAILFCYAADDANSFRSVSRFYQDAAVYLYPNTSIYLVETKADLQNKINEHEFKDLTENIKFESHFKVCGLKKENVIQIFTKILDKVESTRELNASQTLGRTSGKVPSNYASPEKRGTAGSIQETRYSDKKEKIVLMEGSYVKRLATADHNKSGMEHSVKLQPKKVDDVGHADEY